MTRMIVAFAALLAVGQPGGLKIVVIAGEDAVNIIQQKTAVAPVVEVRDRNDLPVAGVPVSFTVGSNATFGGGVQTISVTTNAAGRAAVTSLTPLNSGAVQINVSASVQGQTVTATIAQTNFVTAAAAAAAGVTVATVAGAAAAAGGGLSGLAIAGIVGGGAAAAVVGVQAISGGAIGGGERCRLEVGELSFTVASFGGQRQVFASIRPETCAQTWTATANDSFLTVTQTGSQALVDIQPNPQGSPPRTGRVTIAGEGRTEVATFIQNTACVFSVTPTALSFPRAGGSATLTLTAVPANCDNATWTVATGGQPFIMASPTSGSGSGTIVITLQPNPNPFARGVTIFIGNTPLRIPVIQQP